MQNKIEKVMAIIGVPLTLFWLALTLVGFSSDRTLIGFIIFVPHTLAFGAFTYICIKHAWRKTE
jgi:hypothetical protein